LRVIESLYMSSGDHPPDEYVCIVNEEGTLIMHTLNPVTVGNYAGDNLVLGSGGQAACPLVELPQIATEYVGDYVSSTGQLQIAAFVHIPQRHWTLGVHRSKEVLDQEVKSGLMPLFLGFLIVGGLMMPVSLVLLYITFQRAQRDRRQAEENLRASLREKEILLSEIHHRVKNNMQVINSLLSLQASKETEPKVIEAITESKNRVISMALVHEALYKTKSFAQIELLPYITNLTNTLQSTYATLKPPPLIKISVPSDLTVDLSKASPCGLILNELISNSLKHAFNRGEQGEISITAQRTPEDEIMLVLSDNGQGIPSDIDWRNPRTLGLSLVTDLVEGQLRGSIELSREGGTRFTIRF
ncbi:MAG: sensor histidine kinase, partial [Chloroflexota bacterium]